MKPIAAIVSILLMTTSAPAADFRSLNFGESCSDVVAREYRLGNSPRPAEDQQDTGYQFNGVFLDRAVTIVYFCDETGRLDRGMYAFELITETDLEAFFRVARPGLEHRLGPPSFDGSKINTARRFDNFTHALRWDTERATINLKVVGNFDQPDAQKQLQIWYRPAR